MADNVNLNTPLSRLVGGNMSERSTHDYDGNPYEAGKGPFELHIAVPKNDPNASAFLGALYQKAAADYAAKPAIVQRMQAEYQSGFRMGTFRFKVRDGDAPNREGQVNENKKGHWVVYASSYRPFKASYTDHHGLTGFTDAMGQPIPPGREIDPKSVKIGDYAYVALGVSANGNEDHTAGLYVNINGVMLAARGQEITGGISLDQAFAGMTFSSALPTGATVAASAPAPAGLPAPAAGGLPVPGNVAPVAAAPVMAAPAPVQAPAMAAPAIASPGNIAPHAGFVQAATGGAPVGLPLPGQ